MVWMRTSQTECKIYSKRKKELEGSVLEMGNLFGAPVCGPALRVHHPIPRDSSDGHDLLEAPGLDLVQCVVDGVSVGLEQLQHLLLPFVDDAPRGDASSLRVGSVAYGVDASPAPLADGFDCLHMAESVNHLLGDVLSEPEGFGELPSGELGLQGLGQEPMEVSGL